MTTALDLRRRIATTSFLIVVVASATASSGCASDSGSSSDAGTSRGFTHTIVPLQYLPVSGALSPIIGQPYARQFAAAGGRPPYSWSITGGSLPAGHTLNASGLVTGTTTATEKFSYGVTVTDSKGKTSSGTLSGTPNASGTIPFRLPTITLPAYGENQDFGYQPFFEGGTGPYTFTITGLPPGITYDPATGTLMGQPTSSGTFSLSVVLKDAAGNTAQGTPATVSLSVNAPQPIGGGGGGGDFNCAPYDSTVAAGAQYSGIFAYDWVDSTANPPQQGTGSFRVTFSVKCLAPATNGSIALTITTASGSDPYFGAVGSVTAKQGSVMLMPANPPTTPSNPSRPGQGIVIHFPNGAILGTSNQTAGEFTVLGSGAPFKIISNSAAPAWSLVNASNASAFAPASNPRATVTAKSWNFDHN